jgi:alpha-tubulin suppressor-like RCC1 family protein
MTNLLSRLVRCRMNDPLLFRLLRALGGTVLASLSGCGDSGQGPGSSGSGAATSESGSTMPGQATDTAPTVTGQATDTEFPPPGRRVVAGEYCSCVLRDDGTFRCWGSAANFCTGWGGALPEDIGDNETPASVGDVPAGFGARDLDLGEHSCAVSNTGEVRCWGNDDAGQLGLGTSAAPAKSAQESVPATVGVEAEAVAVGERHTCAVTASATIRCWGFNSHGQLGYGHTQNIGDDESPASAGDVSIGGAAVQVVTGGAGLGGAHTCALLKEGEVRCWGWAVADFGYKGSGILGYGNDENVGDNELPSSVGPVALGGKVARLAAGGRHTCALRVDGVVICWGLNQFGALGLGHTEDIGDDETPNPAGIVSLPSAVIDLTASWYGTCVVLTGGELRCWGSGAGGTHGYGHTMDLGDDELPVNLGPVMVGGAPAVQITAGRAHVCALLADSALRCWGYNGSGSLGYGNTIDIGDDEPPASAGDVPYES